MATFKNLYEIRAWDKARQLVKRIYQITDQGQFVRDRGLQNQIRRASVSVVSNIAEGFERYGDSEFAHFLSLAKGSLGEVQTQLLIATDIGYIDFHNFSKIKSEINHLGNMIGALMVYLRQSKIRGIKDRVTMNLSKPIP